MRHATAAAPGHANSMHASPGNRIMSARSGGGGGVAAPPPPPGASAAPLHRSRRLALKGSPSPSPPRRTSATAADTVPVDAGGHGCGDGGDGGKLRSVARTTLSAPSAHNSTTGRPSQLLGRCSDLDAPPSPPPPPLPRRLAVCAVVHAASPPVMHAASPPVMHAASPPVMATTAALAPEHVTGVAGVAGTTSTHSTPAPPPQALAAAAPLPPLPLPLPACGRTGVAATTATSAAATAVSSASASRSSAAVRGRLCVLAAWPMSSSAGGGEDAHGGVNGRQRPRRPQTPTARSPARRHPAAGDGPKTAAAASPAPCCARRPAAAATAAAVAALERRRHQQPHCTPSRQQRLATPHSRGSPSSIYMPSIPAAGRRRGPCRHAAGCPTLATVGSLLWPRR
eukprot:365182-Chlamydomonas_euryale.AAC.2